MDRSTAYLKTEKTYEIVKGNHVFDGLKKVDEWEGFHKLQNDRYTFIIGVDGVFHTLREVLDLNEDRKVTVVKAPPIFWKE